MATKESYSETKERIRQCAMELFKEQGYDNVTVVQICDYAGVTKRTFYYHYESKDELLSGATNYIGMQAERLLASMASQQTNVGILWTLMSVYSNNSQDYGSNIIKQIYINMLQGKVDEQFPYTMYLYNTVVRTIDNAQRAGEITNKATAEDIAFALYHGFRSATITWSAQDGNFDLVREFRRIFNTILGVVSEDY